MNLEMLAESVEFNSYVSLWKLCAFVVVFAGWAWAGQWVNKDTKVVTTNQVFWNNIYMGAGVLSLVFWFFLPAPFLVNMPIFVIMAGTVLIIYILHRNARVPDNETLLTREHIRWVMSGESKDKDKKTDLRLEFISANGNELPVPHKMDDEYYGYTLAEELIHDIWNCRVSFAKIVPQGEGYRVHYVIDGISTINHEFDREDGDEVIEYIKAVAGLDVSDRRRPQSGKFRTVMTDEGKVDWDVCTSGSTRGEELSLERNEEMHTLPLEELGLQDIHVKWVEEEILKSEGVILVTGLPKSGITSTLYSFLRRHDAFTQNIYSLEEETMCELDNVTQIIVETGPNAPSRTRQLQSAFHSDPDTMMVGFYDGAEMAKMGTEAASKGKKLYFGLESNGVLETLKNWIEIVGDDKKVAKTLLMITNQRMVRKLCLECRESYTPDVATLKKLNLPVGHDRQFFRPPTEEVYDKNELVICENCQGTGYCGRTAVFETLFLSDDLKALIAESAPWDKLRTQCRKERMLYLQEQAVRMVVEGISSIKEVLRITASQKTKKKLSKK